MNKQEFFDRDSSHYFLCDTVGIVEYCNNNYPEEVAHILRVANEVCRNFFLFDLKWDMERTYKPVTFEGKVDWNYIPEGDPEFVWQFNRHRFFICLGQAYQLTGDEKYAKAYVNLTREWIKNVPLTEKFENGPWRSLETGLRGEYWNKALPMFMKSKYITEEFLQEFYNCMLIHAEHLIESHSSYRYISNWGVIENHGLFLIGLCLPQSRRTKRYLSFAIKNLEIQAKMQIMDDGVHWEQSPMYHNEVLHCYLDILILAQRNNIKIPEIIFEQTKKMVLADIAWSKPNHHQIMMGDSDDTDIRDLISVAAYVFKNPIFKFAGYEKLDFESIWDLGMKANESYKRLESKEPEFTSIFLEHSGNIYFRSDWSEKANFLHMHSGTLGAGHGHSDKLHIDLVLQGEDVLMDTGRFSYVSGPKRFEYKDPTGHNTITVDDKLFTVCKDSWECFKLAQPVKQCYRSIQTAEFAQAGHLGYLDMPGGVYINRKVVYIKPDIYILADEMYTGDYHTYKQYFHFNNEGEVVHLQKRYPMISYRGQRAKADFYFVSEGINVELKTGHISRHYNMEEDNSVCNIKCKGDGFKSLITVIDANPDRMFVVEKIPVESALKGNFYSEKMAEAVKIKASGKEYVVIICHQEINSPTDLAKADGCMGYGNVILFDKGKETLVGEVLNW